MSTHNIFFYEEISKIITKYHQIYTLSFLLFIGDSQLQDIVPELYDFERFRNSIRQVVHRSHGEECSDSEGATQGCGEMFDCRWTFHVS